MVLRSARNATASVRANAVAAADRLMNYRATTTTAAVSTWPVDAMTMMSVVPGATPTTVHAVADLMTVAMFGDDAVHLSSNGGVSGLPPVIWPSSRVLSPTVTVARSGES